MDKIPLTVARGDDDKPRARPPEEKTPLAGYMAVGFGLLGIFGPAILFTPLGLLFSIIALLRGQGSWGFVGLLLTIGGILGSPILMGLIGVGALYVTFDWQEIMRPIYELFGGGVDI
ncbi:MAG: hypothetical protein JJ900_13835 [Rhodospirillales bacterium]|nr:hypothetical protein [Rhodospirillales bacterium]MBO6787924.1 hypothetical protein [Rhodospirillales bacterium]